MERSTTFRKKLTALFKHKIDEVTNTRVKEEDLSFHMNAFFLNPTIQPAGIRIQSENILFQNIGLDFGPIDLILCSVDAALIDSHFEKKTACQKTFSKPF